MFGSVDRKVKARAKQEAAAAAIDERRRTDLEKFERAQDNEYRFISSLTRQFIAWARRAGIQPNTINIKERLGAKAAAYYQPYFGSSIVGWELEYTPDLWSKDRDSSAIIAILPNGLMREFKAHPPSSRWEYDSAWQTKGRIKKIFARYVYHVAPDVSWKAP